MEVIRGLLLTFNVGSLVPMAMLCDGNEAYGSRLGLGSDWGGV